MIKDYYVDNELETAISDRVEALNALERLNQDNEMFLAMNFLNHELYILRNIQGMREKMPVSKQPKPNP